MRVIIFTAGENLIPAKNYLTYLKEKISSHMVEFDLVDCEKDVPKGDIGLIYKFPDVLDKFPKENLSGIFGELKKSIQELYFLVIPDGRLVPENYGVEPITECALRSLIKEQITTAA